jgi:hypothetical protein
MPREAGRIIVLKLAATGQVPRISCFWFTTSKRSWRRTYAIRWPLCLLQPAREIARMSRFEIYLLIAPLLVMGFGLAMFWLTGWMDRREERRRHAAE